MGIDRKPLRSFFTGYNEQCKTSPVIAPSGKILSFHSLHALNNSGGACTVGIGHKINPAMWTVGEVTVANTPDYLDKTALLQNQTGTMSLFTTTVGDGFMVQSKKKFNVFGFSTDSIISGPTLNFYYFNGSSFVSFSPIYQPTFTASGSKVFAFAAPQSWAPGSTGAVGGGVIDSSSSLYSILVNVSVAGSGTITASDCWVGNMFDIRTNVYNGCGLHIVFQEKEMALEAN